MLQMPQVDIIILHKINSLSVIYTCYFFKKIQFAYCVVYMFHLKTRAISDRTQTTSLHMDHKLGIQRLEQTLVEAVYIVVHDQENDFSDIKSKYKFLHLL